MTRVDEAALEIWDTASEGERATVIRRLVDLADLALYSVVERGDRCPLRDPEIAVVAARRERDKRVVTTSTSFRVGRAGSRSSTQIITIHETTIGKVVEPTYARRLRRIRIDAEPHDDAAETRRVLEGWRDPAAELADPGLKLVVDGARARAWANSGACGWPSERLGTGTADIIQIRVDGDRRVITTYNLDTLWFHAQSGSDCIVQNTALEDTVLERDRIVDRKVIGEREQQHGEYEDWDGIDFALGVAAELLATRD